MTFRFFIQNYFFLKEAAVFGVDTTSSLLSRLFQATNIKLQTGAIPIDPGNHPSPDIMGKLGTFIGSGGINGSAGLA